MGNKKDGSSAIKPLVQALLSLSPRQGENEAKAAQLLKNLLTQHNLSFQVHKFTTHIPQIDRAYLEADGQPIECAGCSFVSGKITNADNLISSLIDTNNDWVEPNINFNPRCPQISCSYYYWGPALAIKPGDLDKVLSAKLVQGEIIVQPVKVLAQNILVGNNTSPENIIIAHYDSIEDGATDNASGTAVVMSLILAHPELAENNLFVFSANEELSYDKPIYWGHGFRSLDHDHPGLFEKCRQIIVVDSLGNGETKVSHDDTIIKLAFPINNIDKLQDKISICHGDMNRLMAVYHSKLDQLDQLQEKFLKQAITTIHSLLL